MFALARRLSTGFDTAARRGLRLGSVDRVAEGQAKPAAPPDLRAAAPHREGPLGSSGAAPEKSAASGESPPAENLTARQEPGKPPPTIDPAPAEGTAENPAAEIGDTAKGPAPGGTEPAGGSPEAGMPTRPEAGSPMPAEAAAGSPTPAEGAAAGSPTPAEAAAGSPTPAGGEVGNAGAKVPSDGAGAPGAAPPDPAGRAAAVGAGVSAAATSEAKATAGTSPDSGLATTAAAAAAAAAGAPVAAKRGLLRRVNPVRGVRRVGRGVASWSRRPAGRLILPAVIVVLLLGAAGTAGAYLVPQALQDAASPSATPAFPDGAAAPVASASLPDGLLGGPGQLGGSGVPAASSGPVQPVANGQRPSDVLAGWAQQIGTKVGIPVVALQAYGYAELVLARTTPSCHLSWTTIAAIGKVESNNGSFNGSVLGADGQVQPPIYGLPLNGQGGRQQVLDTDHGVIDGDPTYDRAVGPLQFIPSTWTANKTDADNSGVADPNDIDDASLTAAVYLCKGGRDMSKAASWWEAILSYNAVQPYAQKVFDTANDYGQRSRA